MLLRAMDTRAGAFPYSNSPLFFSSLREPWCHARDTLSSCRVDGRAVRVSEWPLGIPLSCAIIRTVLLPSVSGRGSWAGGEGRGTSLLLVVFFSDMIYLIIYGNIR